MSDSKVSVSARPLFGFGTLLAILFIGLKLGGVAPVATWSWLWVLSPLWLGLAAVVAIFVVILFLAALISIFKG